MAAVVNQSSPSRKSLATDIKSWCRRLRRGISDPSQRHWSESTIHSRSEEARRLRRAVRVSTEDRADCNHEVDDDVFEDDLNSWKFARSLSCNASNSEKDKIDSDVSLVRTEAMGPILVIVEFFTERASAESETMDEDRDFIRYNRSRRRPCIISTLNLGESDTQVEEESHEKTPYPGDLVLHNGQALRQSSPPIDSKSANHYGSEGSLVETSSSGSISEKEKARSAKNSKSFLKMLRHKKSAPENLENFLGSLKPSEFKDERLASFRHMGWNEVLALWDAETPTVITEQEKSRRNAVWEIFTNECTFLVDHIMVLKNSFLEPLKKCQVEGLLMDVEPDTLFGNLDELCHLSYEFCRDFVNEIKGMTSANFGSTNFLCDCLDKMTLNSRDGDIYHRYLLNYRAALTYLESLRNTVEEYAGYEKHCEQDPRCNRLPLSALLVAPMQHWTRLPLILARVRKYTETQQEMARLDQSIDRVVSSLKSLENKMEWLKTFERVKEIQQQLIWPTVSEIESKAFIPESLRSVLNSQPNGHMLDDQEREVAYEGPLMLTEKDRTIDVYVFLFTDFLLITKLKKDNKKTRGRMSTIEKAEGFYHLLRQPIAIENLTVHNISSIEASSTNMKNMFVLTQENVFQQVIGVFTLQAHTSLGKVKWMSNIQDCKDKQLNKTASEKVARNQSFRKLLSDDQTSTLLKNSQVLEITSSTLPRSDKTSYLNSLNKAPSSDGIHQSPGYTMNKNRTLSVGCLNTELASTLYPLHSDYTIH